ncbi:MAG: class II fructose-1,6-bisphosphate aldolase [Methermicoccaceae archaeon]
MVLVSNKELMDRAYEEGYAVGAFNINNMEIVQAIVSAAQEESSPVILEATTGAITYAGMDYLVGMVRTAAQSVDIPMSLHLDHGPDFEWAMKCIRGGFTSVMIDGSKYPYEKNVALSRRVVESAHACGVPVEAELGRLVGVEDDVSVSKRDAFFTLPEEAKRFAEETECDSLAVSIGNAHGIYRGEPELDFERLEEIHNTVEVPLVLHGASGIPDHDITEATKHGISKINIDTELRLAFRDAVRGVVCESDVYDPRKFAGPARDAMREVVRHKIRIFGSKDKA